MSIDEERFTFKEVAKMLKVSISIVWRWHLSGTKGKKLASVLIGGRRFVTRSQLDEFCDCAPEKGDRRIQQQIAKRKLKARGV